MTYNWIEPKTVLIIHDLQIRDHGGATGIRDLGLIESALARPRNLSLYASPTITELAAEYAFGLAKNHGFVDGNKRTARIVSNAILMNEKYCPLSFRTVDSIDYKKAMLLFYEQNNISNFKEIFMNQFEFAVNTYF